jgi:hypothetical protein
MRLASTAHFGQPWRIHEIAHDFRLEDVWAMPGIRGGADDFPRLVDAMASYDPARQAPAMVRTLFEVRSRLGRILGWDRPESGAGNRADVDRGMTARVPSLLERVPLELLGTAPPPEQRAMPFTPLFQTANEWAAELANETVHGLLHLGWVADDGGGFHGQLAILVKPNGLLGAGYMAAIKPFRHLIVYPSMLRQVERDWVAESAPV